MPYTTYLFDFDYTLADSSRGITLCFRHVLERNGYAGVTDEAIRRTIGKTLEESFSILTGVTDPDRLAAFKAEYRREADVYMTPNTRLFPETLRVLRTLKERGAKIGIISTKYRFRIHDTMDQHLPADFLDIVVGGEDVSRRHPPTGREEEARALHRRQHRGCRDSPSRRRGLCRRHPRRHHRR